jgi:hypothetical protein
VALVVAAEGRKGEVAVEPGERTHRSGWRRAVVSPPRCALVHWKTLLGWAEIGGAENFTARSNTLVLAEGRRFSAQYTPFQH